MRSRRRALSRLLLLLLLWRQGDCLAPPHPNARETHSRNRKRKRRLQQAQNFTMKILSPELCHDLTLEECQQMDSQFEEHGRKLRKLMSASGLVEPLVLLMRFPDHSDRELPQRKLFDVLWNGRQGVTDPDIDYADVIPTGSVNDFLEKNSYNRLVVHAQVVDWKTTDETEAYYSFGQSGLTRRLAPSLSPLLRELDDEGFDFSRFDKDGDKVLDSVIVLHSGYAAELAGHDCVNGRGENERIWSHAMPEFQNDWVSEDGYTVGSYAIGSAMRGTCGARPNRFGVMTHEFIHSWGIPDLYDVSNTAGKGIGSYDIMSNPYGLDGSQTRPNHLSPWSKIESGWLEPIEITRDDTYSIEASALSPDVYIIRKKFPVGEYLLIENRQPIGWDEYLYDGGILIWHIDDTKHLNTDRGFPGQEGWPGNGNHYRVALAGADRKYDLEKGNNLGDSTDFWVEGRLDLAPGPAEYEVTDRVHYPNTNSYMNGVIWQTGIRIYGFSASGTVMSFSVEGLGTEQDTPAPTANPSRQPTSPPTPIRTTLPTPLMFRPTSIQDPTTSQPVTNPPSLAPTTPSPNPTRAPTRLATPKPSNQPTQAPITVSPTKAPTIPTTPNILPPPSSSSGAYSVLRVDLLFVFAVSVLWYIL